MKILITGLCFNGNLGGPALALGLRDGILAQIPEAELTFAVTQLPGDVETAGETYGCRAIPTPSDELYRNLRIPEFVFVLANRLTGRCRTMASCYRELRQACATWERVLAETDAVVNLSGVAFVGDGMRPVSVSVTELFPFRQATKAGKSYARFIQSFGPFDDEAVAACARTELRCLHRIYARGNGTVEACRKLLPESEVEAFPDCAIRLESEGLPWRTQFFEEQAIPDGPYAIVSPSAVIRSKKTNGPETVGANYVSAIAGIVTELVRDNQRVLLLPHACYPDRPAACDRDVCREVFGELSSQTIESGRVHLIQSILTAPQAKEIIRGSQVAVVSRYHAAIAAVSTATPVIAIGWNQKYRDILEMYGLPDFAIDARQTTEDELCRIIIDKVNWWQNGRAKKVADLEQKHQANIARLDVAFEMLCEWLESEKRSNR